MIYKTHKKKWCIVCTHNSILLFLLPSWHSKIPLKKILPAWKTFSNNQSLKIGMPDKNSLNILDLIRFNRYRIHCWQLFSFYTSKISCHFWPSWFQMRNLMSIQFSAPLKVMCNFSQAAFETLFLTLIFKSLIKCFMA